MKILCVLCGVLTLSLSAAEVFLNGNFAANRRGEPMLWSRIMGNKPAAPIGKMSVIKQSKGGNILKLESFGKAIQIHSTRPVRVQKNDKITISFLAKGKGAVHFGLMCYNHRKRARYNGPIRIPGKKLTAQWQKVQAEVTIKNFLNGPTDEFRAFFIVSAGGSAEIKDLSLQGDFPSSDVIANPSFEYGEIVMDGLFSWFWNNRYGKVELCTDGAPDQKRYLAIHSVPSGKRAEVMFGWERFAGCYQELNVKPGTTYTVSALMKSAIKDGAAGFGFQFLDQYSNRLADHPRPLKYFPLNSKLNTKGWIPVSYSFKIPPECKRLKLFVAGDNFTGKFFVDKVELQEGSIVPQVPLVKVVNEAAWKNALCFDDFIKVGSLEKNSRDFLAEVISSDVKTKVQLLTTAGRLYIRITGEEPLMEKRLLKSVKHDSKPYDDDSVEIFIDPNRDRQNFYQIAISSAGVVYDAFGRNKKWDPKSLNVKASRGKNKWIIDFSISFLDLGYGEQEYQMPDKKIGFALFRNRRLTVKGKELERSSFLQWAWPVYQDAQRYCPVDVCVNGIKGKRISYLYHSIDNPMTARPRQAWKTENPMYKELMGTKRMHPDLRIPVGDCEIGRFISGNYWWNSTAFALRSGMKYHFAEIVDLTREMRISSEMVNAFAPGRFTNRMLKKYPIAVEWYLIPQFAGSKKIKYPKYTPNPKRPYHTFYFIPDDRVAKFYLDDIEKDFKRFHKNIAVVAMGHETHGVYFRYYDQFKKLYQEQDPEAWAGFEREAKQKYGKGKYGFPKSMASATPYERIVYHRWFLDKYNKLMKEAAARLKKIKPEVVLISEVEVGNFVPMLYEKAKGTYDYITQQQVPSGSPNRQSIGFGVKIMGDLAETPVRGGPHVEHYFMSLNAEETNEIISEVFRAGGKALSLWLIDWFGKTYTDYYGAPERFAEIRHIFKEIGTMRELNFPAADTAILFSNVTRFAEHWWYVNASDPFAREYESAYTALGPRVGSWFRFISDVQVAEQNYPLQSYKAIYVPSARYQDDATIKRLKEYASRGGTLIMASPRTFELSDYGAKRPGLKKELMGVEIVGKNLPTSSFQFNGRTIAASGNPVVQIKPVGKAKVIARFANGIPAIVVNPYGRGKVITFASNPFSFSLLTDRNSWQMFRQLQKDAGCKLDQKIWNFRFPRPPKKVASPWKSNMVCVTGNAFAWELESIIDGPNRRIPFTASYSTAPDLIRDKQRNCGALFNRRQAMDQPAIVRKPTLPALQTWAAAWKKKDPFAVRLNFQKNIAGGEIKIWCHGDIPAIELYSKVGNKWIKEGAAVLPANVEEVDVREITIPFKRNAKNFEVRFGKRSKGNFFIGEMEVWQIKK